MKKLILALVAVLIGIGCYNKGSEGQDTVNAGEISISADESLKRIIDGMVEIYHSRYPRTKINIKYLPENMAINAMIKGDVRLAAVTRPLFDIEKKSLADDNFTEKPAIVGIEGVALIASKSSGLKTIDLEMLRKILDGKTKYQIGVDNSNSSNVNFLVKKLNIKDIKKAKISAAKNTEELIDFVVKDPSTIGLIGMTWVSDQNSKQADLIKAKVQVLSVAEKPGQAAYPPTAYSIDIRKYPLERLIYMHIRESYWGLGSGFQRFACGQIGQLIVEKEGLQPYYLFDKQLNIKKEAIKD